MSGESASPAKGFARSRKPAPGAALPAVARALRAPRKPAGGLTRAEERALVAAARHGDRTAQRRLAEAVSGTLFRFGKSFCRDDHDAEDLRQDVLVKLLESLPAFRGESALSTWAFTVARRACAVRRRRDARHEPLPAHELVDAHASPAQDVERRELRTRLETALRALPAAQREVVLLRDVEGRTAAEVARALRLTERAVKSRLHRARLALRRALREPTGTAPGPARKRGCPETALLVSRFVEGDLGAGGCRALEAHVRDCPECLAECESLRRALGACRAWGQARPPRTAVP